MRRLAARLGAMAGVLGVMAGMLGAIVGVLAVAAPAYGADPTVVTGSAGAATATTATAQGTVNLNNNTLLACYFEYGTDTNYGQTASCSPTPSGAAAEPVTGTLTGLQAGSTYHYQLVLVYLGLSLGVDGGDRTFTMPSAPPALPASPVGGSSTTPNAGAPTKPTKASTPPPTASTQPATGVTATTATLNGTVNPRGTSVRACGFEWGVTRLAASSQPGQDNSIVDACTTTGSGANQKASLSLRGLAPGTTYYYRILASYNSGAYTVANTRSFKTKANAGTTTATATPGMKITAAEISAKARTARFRFEKTGPAATRGWQCALVTVTRGRAAKPHYKRCTSAGEAYSKLAAKTYIFYVRAGNKNGWGRATSHKFKT